MTGGREMRSPPTIDAKVEDGNGNRTLIARLSELETKEDGIKSRLDQEAVDIPDIHPNVAGIYRRKVERLAEALRSPTERDEAAEAIGHLSNGSRSRPGPSADKSTRRFSDFGAVLRWTAQQQKTPGAGASGVSVSVVAGAGFEPATFRL